MSEKESAVFSDRCGFCPSGCGTALIKRKFADVFHEDKTISLKDEEENLYCTKCHIRWIPEQHSDMLEVCPGKTPARKEEMIEIKVKLYSPFVNFLKDYLAYFGSKRPIEELYMLMIYRNCKAIYEELTEHHPYIENLDWYEKYGFLACVSGPDEKEE